MPYDKDGNLLWIADETGAHEVLQPGEGYNGRTREPGEPDWWVVAKPPDWRPSGFSGGKADTDVGYAGGGGDFGGSGVTGGFGPGKLAGADSETGLITPPAEPWTLFSATQEHLDYVDRKNAFGEAASTIGAGIGEAVSKGWDATGEALGKTWDARNNEDLKKGVEFGGKAAWEVTKDVGKTVLKDIGYNGWDTAATKGAEYFGLDRVASVVGNPAITIPINKVVGMARTVDDVWNGGQERSTKDLGQRIDDVCEQVYRRKR